MDLTQIIDQLYAAFSGRTRPEHFTNFRHCPECERFDSEIRASELRAFGKDHTRKNAKELICFLTPEAYAHLLPRLLEMALCCETDGKDEPVIDTVLFTLSPESLRDRISGYRSAEIAAVVSALDVIYAGPEHYDFNTKLLQEVILYWSV